jgi:hypothetical protein
MSSARDTSRVRPAPVGIGSRESLVPHDFGAQGFIPPSEPETGLMGRDEGVGNELVSHELGTRHIASEAGPRWDALARDPHGS